MRVRGETEPQSQFTLEDYAKKPGYVLARFFQNARQETDTSGEQPVTYWSWDEYHLILASEPRLQDDIAGNLAFYMDQAIANAPQPIVNSEDNLPNAQIQALSDRNEFLEDCIAEMAGIIYAG